MDEFNPFYGMAKAAFDKFGGKVAEKPAETFGHAYDFVVGPLEYYFKEANLRRELLFEKQRQEILDEMSVIPDENFIDPPLSVVGPALESSKYYIENDEVRIMFAKLFAKSMDSRYTDKINHSFVEILKQLSPVDAYILKKIGKSVVPAAAYKITFGGGESIPLSDYFIIDNNYSIEQISLSLNNIERLGLINRDDSPYSKYVEGDPYADFYLTKEYLDYSTNHKLIVSKHNLEKLLKKHNYDKVAARNEAKVNETTFKLMLDVDGVGIDTVRLKLSTFGNALYEVCIE